MLQCPSASVKQEIFRTEVSRMAPNEKTNEELLKEIEVLKKTIKVQQNTINNLLNKYILNKNTKHIQ